MRVSFWGMKEGDIIYIAAFESKVQTYLYINFIAQLSEFKKSQPTVFNSHLNLVFNTE